jgi:ribosome-associated translation inhibitor RaiA
MPVPLRLTLRQVRPTSKLRTEIRDKVEGLRKFHPRLLSGRVAVEMPHRHHTSGNRFHVRIELKVPGRLIVVNHEPKVVGASPDEGTAKLTKAVEADVVYRYLDVALHAAFEAARRQLQEVSRKENGKTQAIRARVPRRRA